MMSATKKTSIMKKVFLTAMIAAAFAFGMTACGGNATEETTDTTATECCEEAHECCAHEGDSCCHHEGEECCGNHEGCEHQCDGNHEGCQHECQK